MLRLALISPIETGVDGSRQELESCCARLRGVELTTVGPTWESVSRNQPELFDAVIIGSPLENWKDVVAKCVQARKHLLLSNSVLQSSDDLDQLDAQCREANLRLMIGDTIRFQPSINAVNVAVKSGRLGIPALLRSHAWHPPSNDPTSDLQTLLFQQLDLAQWIFGTLPTEIYAVAHQQYQSTSQVHFGFPGGAMTLITTSKSLPEGDRYCSCSVIGSTGAAYADDHRQMQLIYQPGGIQANRTAEGVLARVEELREFAAAIDQHREPSVSTTDARRVMIMMDAVSQSIESRQPLRLEGGNYVSGT